jgi:hypothetical protein
MYCAQQIFKWLICLHLQEEVVQQVATEFTLIDLMDLGDDHRLLAASGVTHNEQG